jgi:hypothetical protein
LEASVEWAHHATLYGNLGQALVVPFRSFTMDFGRMQLCLGEPRNHAE